MTIRYRAALLCAASWPILAVSAIPAWGQDAEPADATEDATRRFDSITVTAQKREQSLQDVSIAVTAISGDAMSDRQINAVDDLTSIAPNMTVGSVGGQARISIRGIGFDTINPGSEGRVAYHIDSVYVSRPGAQLGTFMDVQRVEILRGPQGTLYGRNATGGSINVISNTPGDTLNGYAKLGYGNYNRVSAQAAIGGPIAKGISGRLAGTVTERDGYGESLVTGDDVDDESTFGGRATLHIEPNDVLGIKLSADYSKQDDHSQAFHYFGQYNSAIPLFAEAFMGGTVSNDERDLNVNVTPQNDREIFGTAADVSLDLGAVTLRSITGFRSSEFETLSDYDHTEVQGATISFSEESEQLSQEFQLSGTHGRSNWLLGAYYFEEETDAGSHLPTNLAIIGMPAFYADGYKIAGTLNTEAWAVFGQYDLAVSDRINLIFGARYNEETIDVDDILQLSFTTPASPGTPPANPGPPSPPNVFMTRTDSTSADAFTPKAGIEFSPNEDTLLYATVSRGFKSGGYSIGSATPAYEPEKLWAYEAGAKATTLDGSLIANLATFYYDYSNLQVSKVQNRTVIVENAAAAKLYGAELELTAFLTDALQVDGSLAYLHSEYEDFASQDPGDFDPFDPTFNPPALDLSGNQLYQAPEWTANFGVQHEWTFDGGSLAARGELNYVSRNYFTAFNADILSQPSYTKLNAFLTWRSADGPWSATAYGRNLTDKTIKASGLMGAIDYGGPAVGTYAPPREFGIQLGYEF